MLTRTIWFVVLASWMTACASSAVPASAPASLSLYEEEAALGDGIATVEHHGVPGLFITFETWRAMLIRIELDKRDLQVALARSVTAETIATEEAEAMRKAASLNEWRATYGPWIGFGGGLTVAAIVAAVFWSVLR